MNYNELSKIPSRELDCELLRRSIARTSEAIVLAKDTYEVLSAKILRQREELRRQMNRPATVAPDKQASLYEAIGQARQTAMNLCWQIEKCGASEELTTASIMASELQAALNNLLP